MQKKFNILTFSDVPIPSYQRPYRGILFVDYAPKDRLDNVFVVSPYSDLPFQNESINSHPNYFKAGSFKKVQYRLGYRVVTLLKLFFSLIIFRFKYSNKIDFVRTGTTYLSLFFLLTQKKRTPYFADVCDFYFDLYREFGMSFARIVSPIIFIIEKFSLRGADILFVDTHAQRKFLIEKMGISKKRCVVAPNGILLENFPFLEKKDQKIMDNYGFLDKDLILFYGGDISEMDGIEMILRFMKENEYVSGRRLKLLVIGKGNNDYINRLKKQVESDGTKERIIFDSFKPYAELHRYLSVSDVCLSPFHITTTSNTVECGKIITYLLAGKKILSTMADGVSGLYKDVIDYFESGNYTDFSQKLSGLLAESENVNDVKKRRQLGEKFDFKKIIEHEYEIIDEYFRDSNQDFSKYDYF